MNYTPAEIAQKKADIAELKRKRDDARGFRDAATLALAVVKAQKAARRPIKTASAKASPATAKDVFATYNSLPSGPAKREFLAKHGVEIQRIAKSL